MVIEKLWMQLLYYEIISFAVILFTVEPTIMREYFYLVITVITLGCK